MVQFRAPLPEKMRLKEKRVRFSTWGLACLVGILFMSVGGIFVAGAVVASAEVELGPGVCEILDCEAIDAEAQAREAREKAAREAGRIIYLTFDDGPSEFTGELLDILAKYEVPATFFVTGRGADDLILRMVREGHAIGIHTFSHDYSYLYRNTANFWADFMAVSERISRITGENAVLTRFPGGSSNTVSRRYDGRSRIMSRLATEVLERGYVYFDWNVDSGDAGGAWDAEAVFQRVVAGLKTNGPSIVLQHDTKNYSVAAVPRIIEYGFANGYVFEKLETSSYAARHGINN